MLKLFINRTKPQAASIYIVVLLTLPAIGQEEQIQFTIPSVKPIKQTTVPDKTTTKKDEATTIKASNQMPIRYGLTSDEIVNLLGGPEGKVAFGDRLTFYYNEGEIEFIDDLVDRFKWKGKLYTHAKMPRLARDKPGALTITRSGSPAQPKPTPKDTELTVSKSTTQESSKNQTSGLGTITTSDGRSASTAKPSRATAPAISAVDKLNAISEDRKKMIEDAGLGEILKAK